MTNSQNNGQPTSRLDQIEIILLRVAQQQEVNTQAIANLQANQKQLQTTVEQNTAAIAQVEQQLEASISHLVGLIGDFVESAQQDRAVIREIQSEVKGIQTENQRILQYLFGQREE